jgi:eukaryotic-like serine/threonine-protein kinase
MSDTMQPDEAAAMVGARLGGKYDLVRLLGRGGMGAVYEATNVNTGRRVAIKTLHAHMLRDAQMRKRFLQEARAATQIEHPNVIDVLDLDIDASLGVPFIVQEFLSGATLAERLDATPSQRFAPDEALAVAVPVMGALIAAHALGIVHRDLKPENIFLVRERSGGEVPRVIDFGIAKFIEETDAALGTRTGVMLGTPAYMSPEQATGLIATLDAQTDVWAMGVVLYEMLSGRLPYEAENAHLTVGMIQYREPVPLSERMPDLDADLVAVIHRALTKDRTARYPTMQAFLGDLLETSAWTRTATSVSAPPSLAPSLPTLSNVSPRVSTAPTPRRDRRWWALIAASLVAISVVGVVARSDHRRARAAVRAAPPQTASAPSIAAPPIAAPPIAAPIAVATPEPPPLAAAPLRVHRAPRSTPSSPRPARGAAHPSQDGTLHPDREWRP